MEIVAHGKTHDLDPDAHRFEAVRNRRPLLLDINKYRHERPDARHDAQAVARE